MTEQQNFTRSVERVRLELVGRKFMVTVLALIGVWVGVAMILTGAPNFIEDWFSPWSRYFVGGAAFLAGLLTSVGGAFRDDRRAPWWCQVIGLALLVLWYGALGAAYVGLTAQQGLAFVGPGEPLPEGITGRGYVPLVYLGLMVMTATPLATMLKLRRPDVLGPGD